MQTLSMLQPNPNLKFDPIKHQYTVFGEPVPWSVTGITSHDMDPKVKAIIDKTKDKWSVRGNTIHECLEAHLTGAAELNAGDYTEWVKPLLEHPLWSQFEAIGVEHRMVSPDRFYAGSIDVLLKGNDKNGEPQTILADLKTLSSKRSPTRSISKQAGAYICLLADVERIQVDKVLGVFSKPGSVEITVEDPQDCIDAWLDCLDAFKKWKPSF